MDKLSGFSPGPWENGPMKVVATAEIELDFDVGDLYGIDVDIFDLLSEDDGGKAGKKDGGKDGKSGKKPRIVYVSELDDDEDDEKENDYNTLFGDSGKDSYKKNHGRKEQEQAYDTNEKKNETKLKVEIARNDPDNQDYVDTLNQGHLDKPGVWKKDGESGTLSVEYESPTVINGQSTYQRIVFEADKETTVYELSMGTFDKAGVEHDSYHDGEFDAMMFGSISGKKDGEQDNYWEFYVNGQIGKASADKAVVKPGDIVEWRRAEESDGTCGGSPDYAQIKSMVHSNELIDAYDKAMKMRPGGYSAISSPSVSLLGF